MQVLREIGLYLQRKIKETLRNSVFLIMGVTTPLLYLLLFFPLLKNFPQNPMGESNSVILSFVPGMLTMIAFLNGLFGGWAIIDELRSGIIERFRVTPSSRFAIMIGPVLRDLITTLFQLGFFTLIAALFGFRADIGGLILFFILLSLLLIVSSAFANTMGLITKSEDKLAPIVHGINLPIMLLSGMLLPLSLGPTWLKVLACFTPAYYVVEAGRSLVLGHILEPIVGQAFLVMTILVVMMLSFATRVFKKAVM